MCQSIFIPLIPQQFADELNVSFINEKHIILTGGYKSMEFYKKKKKKLHKWLLLQLLFKMLAVSKTHSLLCVLISYSCTFSDDQK